MTITAPWSEKNPAAMEKIASSPAKQEQFKFIELLTRDGIDHPVATGFSRSLGPHYPNFITDYKADQTRWTSLLKAEELMFARIGLFSSDERYRSYMTKHKKLIYVFYMDLLKHLYGDDYNPIVKRARERFKAQAMKNLRKWVASIFSWDPFWLEDSEFRGPLLEQLDQLSARERLPKKTDHPPLVAADEYKETLLYPLLEGVKIRHRHWGAKTQAAYVELLGITGMKRSSIETTLFHGSGKGNGLLKYKGPTKPQLRLRHSTLAQAYSNRLDRAVTALVEEFAANPLNQSRLQNFVQDLK